MTLNGVGRVARVVAQRADPAIPPRIGTTLSLLPAPTALGDAGLDDAMTLLLKLTIDANRRQLAVQKADIAAASGQRELQMKELEKKFQEWFANQNNPLPALADLFKVIGIALSAVATAMTGGALSGVMVGAIALSVAGFMVEKTDMFGPEASKYVAMVMGAVSTVAGGVCNLASAAGTAVKAGEEAAKVAAREVMGKVADVSQTVTSLGEDAVHLGDAVVTHNQTLREADVKDRQNHLEQVRRTIALLIEGVKELNQVRSRAVETVSDTIRVSSETGAMVAAGTRV